MSPINPRDPWEKSPPFDIDKFERTIKRYAIPFLVLVVIIIAAASSYYTVQANEEALVLRLGKYQGITGSGLHFKIPLVDRVIIKPVATIQKEEFGFRTLESGRVSTFDYGTEETKEVSQMLTADLNAAVVNWVVRYKIKDLQEYLFNVQDVEDVIRDVSEAVMRRIVGNNSIDEVLMIRTQEIENMAQEEMKGFLEKYKCGIYIESVKLKSVNPPEEVKDAFDAVPQARQKRDQIITDAEAKRNREIIPAEGKKTRVITEANGYKQKRINEAAGDAKEFLAVLEEYQKAKDITRRRLYLETMAKILPLCGEFYLIDKEQKGLLPILRLGEEKGDKK